jgi:TRAP-type C4-dicarboxylate transport system substrate-binding protein
MFSAMGANPTQMSWADAQPALSSGAVDGQENPLYLFQVLKMQTVGQKFITTWGYVADPLVFVVNKEIWGSWTPADQAIVRQAALDAGSQEIGLARKGLVEADKPLLKEIAAVGVTITHLSPAEREAFVKATRPVYDKWKNTVGVELVKAAEAAIAARKK